jgi:hypothetical protein
MSNLKIVLTLENKTHICLPEKETLEKQNKKTAWGLVILAGDYL